jgi:putative addiction module antidote
MNRKVFRSGNSLVVSLPPDILDRLHLIDGSEVNVVLSETEDAILLRPVGSTIAGISPEYAARVESFIEAYRPALESLSQR